MTDHPSGLPEAERVPFLPGDAQRETLLLFSIIETVSSGPDVETLAAAVARLITSVTMTDVCFVHVLDDAERSLTLAGATAPFDAAVGQIQLPMGDGVTGWVAAPWVSTVAQK